MEHLKLNATSLSKQTRGILLHSGYTYISDILPYHNNLTTLKTEPPLTPIQLNQLSQDLTQLLNTYNHLLNQSPLQFNQPHPPSPTPSIFLQDPHPQNYLDTTFALGQVIEMAGPPSSGKTQICF